MEFDDARIAAPGRGADLIALDDALAALTQFDPREARVVELCFFGGLSEEEMAEVPGISSRAVKRDWALAKAWLTRDMKRVAKQ